MLLIRQIASLLKVGVPCEASKRRLIIKNLITKVLEYKSQLQIRSLDLWFKGMVNHFPGQHHDVALAQRATCDLLPRTSL